MSGSAMSLPYPGLRAFTRDESMLFFGRENCVDAMIERLAATRFLAVLGASGSGKSSLVRTGLFDGLELGFFARAGARWRIVETHPGGAPMRNLAQALAHCGDDGDLIDDIETLLGKGRRSLIEWAAGTRLAPGENLLILVDQFEELFRYSDYAAREEAEDFVALLIESARATDLPIHIVITMRSEYLGACALIPGLAEQLNAGFYLTPRMTREECRQAIEGPAAITGFSITPALTNRILNDMEDFAPWEEEQGVVQSQMLSKRADQLPLMQHLLNRLWLRAGAQGGNAPITLTVADYEAIGGLIGALDAHGAQVLASLPVDDQCHVATVFRCLISGPDPTNAVRRPARFSEITAELATQPGSEGAAQRIIDAFRAPDCNFLQPPSGIAITDDTLIDITHESLIRQWTTLAQWLQDEARAGANWQRLHNALQRFDAGEGGVLQGLDLKAMSAWWEAEQPTEIWAARHGGQYQRVAAFLSGSLIVRDQQDVLARDRERSARFRLRATLSVVSTLLVISVVLGLWAWHENRRRTELVGNIAALEEGKKALEKETAQGAKNVRIAEEQLKQIEKESAQAQADRDEKTRAMAALQSANDRLNSETQEAKMRFDKQMSLAGIVGSAREAVEYCRQGGKYEEGCKRLLDSAD